MTKRMNDEERLEARDAARCKADDKAYAKLSAEDGRRDDARAMIGHLIREGRKVFYVSPVGGKYREGSEWDLTEWLMRRGYA